MAKNEWSCNYTTPIYLHEMHRSYSTDFTFITKRHGFTFLKKEIIIFKPKLDSSLTLLKQKNVPLKAPDLLQLQDGVRMKDVPKYKDVTKYGTAGNWKIGIYCR